MARFVVVLIGCLVAAGCSDPMDATESNFEDAINIYLSGQPECISIASPGYFGDSMDLPVTIAKNSRTYRERTEYLDGFVDAELLKSESRTTKDQYGMAREQKVYELSENGHDFYQKPRFGSGEFCFGNKVVAEILQFTEPAEAQGVKVTRVKFTYEVENIPDWVKSDTFSKVASDAIASGDTPIKTDVTLFLTSNGWSHDI